MSPKPHVEVAAIIPDDQGRIVIGKRKGKEGAGTAYDQIRSAISSSMMDNV